MKSLRYIWLLAVIFGLAWVSCKEDDTTVSTITSFEKFNAELPSVITVTEPESADETHIVTISFNENQIMDIHIEVAVSPESTAEEGVDFSLGAHEYEVTALRREAHVEVIIHPDVEAEGDETIVLSVHGLDPYGVPLPAEGHVITIKNRVYPTDLYLDWEGEYTDSAGTHSLCGAIDIDLFVADDQGNLVGGFGGATAACPEHMSVGGLPDGTYNIVANLYDNGALGSTDLVQSAIPLTAILAKGGQIGPDESTVLFSTAGFAQVTPWTTFTPSDPNGEANVIVGRIRVTGGVVTLINPAGGEVGSL